MLQDDFSIFTKTPHIERSTQNILFSNLKGLCIKVIIINSACIFAPLVRGPKILETFYGELVWDKLDLINWRNTNANKTPQATILCHQCFLRFVWRPWFPRHILKFPCSTHCLAVYRYHYAHRNKTSNKKLAFVLLFYNNSEPIQCVVAMLSTR